MYLRLQWLDVATGCAADFANALANFRFRLDNDDICNMYRCKNTHYNGKCTKTKSTTLNLQQATGGNVTQICILSVDLEKIKSNVAITLLAESLTSPSESSLLHEARQNIGKLKT